MNLIMIKALLENKIHTIEQAKNVAMNTGDIDSFSNYEQELTETKATLAQLNGI